MLTYSGDTPVDVYEKWNNTKILIHEATFLTKEEQEGLAKQGKNKHSNLEEVLRMVTELNIETLILGHFSSRYSSSEIDSKIKMLCNELNVKIPVFRVLPGKNHFDILSQEPIN